MKDYAPSLWNFNVSTLNMLEVADKGISRQFDNHPFAGMTFNFGPRTCTLPHKDLKNLSWGWCPVTSFGTYNPTKGGHLVLWDLRLVVEFPPYSTILIPSAILMHSNTRVRGNETRLTVTQYNSAGLFSWVAHDYGPKGGSKKSGVHWWDRPRHLFSKLEQLVNRRN
jgi:hypothetical protein